MNASASASALPAAPSALPARAWIGFVAMVFGNFMAILDIQIVASSLNQIQAGLSASAEELTWVQTSYLIAEVIAIPLSGYLSRLLSTRIYFTISAIGFTLASLACAFAWNIESMVVFRALQGFLGGGMIPTTFAAMFMVFPPEKRTVPLVSLGLVSTLAPALGPTIGGYLTAAFSWHWLFLINLLPGLLVAFAVWNLVHIDKPDWSLARRIDFIGLGLMALFLGSLEYVLDEGPRHDWLEDATVRPLAFVAVITGAAFFWRSLTHHEPIVDLRVFRNRNFAAGSVVAFVVGVMLYGIVYLVPLFFGTVRGYSSLQIGHVMMVTGIAMFLSAPLAGQAQKRLDLRLMLAYGLAAVSLGTFINANLTAQSSLDQFFWPQILRGHGFMFCMVSMTGLALGTLRPEEMKNGSGLFNLMRNLGGALGLAVINTLLSRLNSMHWSHLAETVNLSRTPVREAAMAATGALSPALGTDAQPAAIGLFAQRVAQQALVMSFNDLLLIMALLVASLAFLLPLIDKPQAEPGSAAAH
ncbi:MAG TPA: DHA2 family efflux MFS transporter permease subunit [Solimonas sp.]|nr:DHA2 family efflux MFS transporter permease subunit [Solimonas sp.]